MSGAVSVRPLRPHDADWALGLYKAEFAAWIPWWQRALAWRGLRRAMVARGWVAEQGGASVGFGFAHAAPPAHPTLRALALSLGEARPGADPRGRWTGPGDWRAPLDEAWLLSGMVVEAPARRRGIGRALAAARVRAARDAGAAAVFATCLHGCGSDPLYDGLGFGLVADVPDLFAGGGRATLRVRLLP